MLFLRPAMTTERFTLVAGHQTVVAMSATFHLARIPFGGCTSTATLTLIRLTSAVQKTVIDRIVKDMLVVTVAFLHALDDYNEFGWLRKKNKPREVSAEENMRILQTYFALLQAHPHHFMDASWLPARKQKMIELFKTLWLAGNDEMRKKTENWWCLLSRFQPGLGGMPITFEISKGNPTAKEWREREAQVEPWLETGISEDILYESEIKRFKARALDEVLRAGETTEDR